MGTFNGIFIGTKIKEPKKSTFSGIFSDGFPTENPILDQRKVEVEAMAKTHPFNVQAPGNEEFNRQLDMRAGSTSVAKNFLPSLKESFKFAGQSATEIPVGLYKSFTEPTEGAKQIEGTMQDGFLKTLAKPVVRGFIAPSVEVFATEVGKDIGEFKSTGTISKKTPQEELNRFLGGAQFGMAMAGMLYGGSKTLGDKLATSKTGVLKVTPAEIRAVLAEKPLTGTPEAVAYIENQLKAVADSGNSLKIDINKPAGGIRQATGEFLGGSPQKSTFSLENTGQAIQPSVSPQGFPKSSPLIAPTTPKTAPETAKSAYTLEQAKTDYITQLRQISPQQPEAWYQGQLAMQPFVKNPSKYGITETAITGKVGNIAPSVVQTVNIKTGEKKYFTVDPKNFDEIKNLIDENQDGIAGKPINDEIYHLTAKNPAQMEEQGFISAGQITPKEIPSIRPTDPLIAEARKYKSAEEFVKAKPKTVQVWNKSKFSNDGAYTNIPVIRKEENITLYHGGEQGQFWTPDKKYAEQFGNVKEKKGTFYKIDNGNRVTDVYVEAPTKSQLTDIWKKANEKPIDSTMSEVSQQGNKTSGIATSINAKAIEQGMTDKGFENLAEFNGTSFKEQADLVSKLDTEQAKAIVRGEQPLPPEIRSGALISAMEDLAKQTGDVELMQDLANSPLATKISESASEVSLARMREKDSATIKLQEIKKARQAKVEKQVSVEKQKIAKSIKAETEKINLSPDELSWENFLETIKC